jgi:hypothetical protein
MDDSENRGRNQGSFPDSLYRILTSIRQNSIDRVYKFCALLQN